MMRSGSRRGDSIRRVLMIVEILQRCHRRTAHQVAEVLRPRVHIRTVYRDLDLLVRTGWVRRVRDQRDTQFVWVGFGNDVTRKLMA